MPLEIGVPLPSLSGATEWVNGTVTETTFSGFITLVQFWAISCPMCKKNLPTIQRWQREYSSIGVRVISVHMPRGQSDTRVESVTESILENAMIEPCAIDNEHLIGRRFQTQGLWPYYFLFDREGKLRSRAAGAMGLKLAENSLRRLLELETQP